MAKIESTGNEGREKYKRKIKRARGAKAARTSKRILRRRGKR